MNYVTEAIIEKLGVSIKEALQIQDIMDESDIDFSECSWSSSATPFARLTSSG